MALAGASGLHRLVYASSAAEPLFADKLDRILLRAQVANRENNISGLLLFREGRFLQVLEGPRRSLNDLFARISRDRTHRDIALIEDAPCSCRIFADTPLAYLPGRYFTPGQREALAVLMQVARESSDVLADADVDVLLAGFR